MKTLALLVSLCCAVIAHAESARFLGAKESLADGDVISLVSLAPGANGQCLAGRARGDELSAVSLSVAEPGPAAATRWRVSESAPGVYALQCLGVPDGRMWLDGHTLTGKLQLAHSPNGVSGASWGVYREGLGVNVKCLGKARGPRWLAVGDKVQVGLAPASEGLGALWQVQIWSKAAPASTPVSSEAKR